MRTLTETNCFFSAAEVAVVSPGRLARPRIHEAEAEAKCVVILRRVCVVRKDVSVSGFKMTNPGHFGAIFEGKME